MVHETAGEATVSDAGTAVEITNTTGAIAITKQTIVDPTHPIDPVDTFSFSIDCGANYSGVHELTTDMLTADDAMGMLTFADLPVISDGTECEITELDETPEWTLTTDRSITLTVSSAAPQTATFINERVLGSLVINKTVEGPDDVDLSGEVFEITITCTGGFIDGTHVIEATISATTPYTVDNLPLGANCTVEETADPRFATSYPDTDATIATATDGPADLSILNQTGSFTIDKAAFIDSSRPFDPDDEFSFTISCRTATGEPYEETVTINTTDGVGTWNSPLLPTGHECTIEMTVPDGWAVLSAEQANFVIGTDVQVLGFQSERSLVELTVTKTLASIPSGVDFADREFDITITCDQGFQVENYTIPGSAVVSQDENIVIGDLPAAATCTVTEAEDDFFAATYAPAETIVLSATEANQVTITNTGTQALADWARNPGPLALTGNDAGRLVWLGVLLMGAGAVILGGRRRLLQAKN